MQALDFVVSPELVLVDPELADRVRSSDYTQPWFPFSPPETLADAVRPSLHATEAPNPERGSHQVESARSPLRRRLFHLALALSLGVNVFVLVNVYADSTHTVQALVASKLRVSGTRQRTPALASSQASGSAVSSAVSAQHEIYRPPLGAEALAETAERSVLASLGRNPTLRRRFTAASTGLPSPGVSARCGASNQPSVQRCVVWRQVAGERIASTLDYRVLPHGGFQITLVG
jgi:hypothetical protein